MLQQIRLLCLNRPWAQGWSFSADELTGAATLLEELYSAAGKPGDSGVAALPAALLDDLDVPRALAIALEDGGQAARTLIEMLALS